VNADTAQIEDWVPLYEALFRSEDVDKLREDGGYVWGLWDLQYLEELQARCIQAGLNPSIGFHEDAGYYLAGPGGARAFYRTPKAQKRRRAIAAKHVTRAKARGHRLGSWREFGLRAAYCCDACGDRLYVDVERNLVCGELTTRKRCPDSEANPPRRRWWQRG
jgi:hypothetical protein